MRRGVCALFNFSKCFLRRPNSHEIYRRCLPASHSILGLLQFNEYSHSLVLTKRNVNNSLDSLKPAPGPGAGHQRRLMDSDIRHCQTASPFVAVAAAVAVFVVSVDGLTCLDMAKQQQRQRRQCQRGQKKQQLRLRRRRPRVRQHFSNVVSVQAFCKSFINISRAQKYATIFY